MRVLVNRWRPLGAALVASALAACAQVAPGPGAPSCCATLAELPYRALVPGPTQRVDIGPDAPTVALETGRSPVAAFRLPPTPRPLMIDIVSHQVAGPGTLSNIYLSFLKRAAVAFNPTVLIADTQFRVRRIVSAEGPTVYCNVTDVAGTGPVVQLHVPISEAADESAYLLLATTDAQRGRTADALCRDVPVVYGDTGRIELRLSAPPFGDGRVLLDSAAGWYADRRGLGILNELASGFHDPVQGRLVLGEQRLAYYRDRGDTLQRQFDQPTDAVVMVRASDSAPRTLAVAFAGEPGGPLRWQTFVFPDRARAADAQPADFERALRQRIRPDAVVETVGVAVPAWPPELGLRVAADAPAGETAASRIGQGAVTGGIVTALPCGLCQVGGCTPDMLVACAAAFSVGAVIGGAWTVGRELLTGGFATRTEPKADPSAGAIRQAAVAPASAASQRFDRAALQQCVLGALTQPGAPAWRYQGLSARFEPLPERPGQAGEGAYADLLQSNMRQVVEVFIDSVALVARESGPADRPTADAPTTLQIEGGVRLIDLGGGRARPQALAWSGKARPLRQWADASAEEIAVELAAACASLAERAVVHANARWLDSR
jgi:hypothetical protein